MDNENTVYSERYVAFIDILGFSHIVRASISFPQQTKRLIAILENVANARQDYGDDSGMEQDDFMTQSFSDCIVMSERASPTGLRHLLSATTALTLTLLESGIFIRGGIAKGLLYHSEKAVFGPALLEAYRIESTIAKFPRILIDRATHADYQSPSFADAAPDNAILPKLSYDTDGPPFLDVLILLNHADETLEKRVSACHSAIQKALDDSVYEPRHFEKIRWLTIYWNAAASDRGASLIRFPQIDDVS